MPDIYLKLDGIDGESKDQNHPQEIEVLSVSFGMSNAGSFGQGSGGGVGKVSIQDLVFTKLVERKYPVIFRELPNRGREYFDEATIRDVVRWLDTLDRI